MPLVNSVCRALSAVILFTSYTLADESCWYPDGHTLSSDIPCNPTASTSACCSSSSFCLLGGLCLTGGIVTRGSCTDKTWGSPACAEFCKTQGVDGEIAITPCSSGTNSNTFVCGLDNDKCKDQASTFKLASNTQLVLRPAQIQELVSSALASGAAHSHNGADSSDGQFSVGTVAGVACGIGLPLLIALAIVTYLLVREKRRPHSRRSMMRLADEDDKGSIIIGPAPSMFSRTMGSSGYGSRWANPFSSGRTSVRDTRTSSALGTRPLYIPNGAEIRRPPTIHSSASSIAESQRASHIPSFAERIEGIKVTPQLVTLRESNSSRGTTSTASSPPLEKLQNRSFQSTDWATRASASTKATERYELASKRLSE